MSSRHERRRFRREVEVSRALRTYLVEPTDPALKGILKAGADHWLDALSHRVRHCVICNVWVVDRRDVGALLLTTPDIAKPVSVGTAAVCKACWDADLGVDALERACETVLKKVVPNGKFEPMGTP